MKKKHKKLLIILGIVLVVVIAAAILIPALTAEPEEPEQDAIVLYSTELENITDISYIYQEEEVALTKESEGWALAEQPEQSIQQDVAEEMATALSEISVLREVEEGEESYGFSEPRLSICFTANGEKKELLIGDRNTVTDTYYLKMDGKAYMVAKEIVTTFQKTVNDIIVKDAAPEIETASVTAMNVSGELNYSVRYIADTEDIAYSSTQHYFLQQEDGEMIPLDSSTTQSLIQAMTGLAVGDVINFTPSEEDIASYGLKDPSFTVEICYNETTGEGEDQETEAKTFHIYLGGFADEEQTNRYVQFEGSSTVYQVKKYLVMDVTDVDLDLLRATDVCAVSFDSVSELDLDWNGESYSFMLDRSDEEDIKVTINGTEISKVYFESFYYDLIGLSIDSLATEETFSAATPKITVTFRRVKGDDLTLNLYDYDTSFYRAEFFGRENMLVNKRDVEAVKQSLEELLAR